MRFFAPLAISAALIALSFTPHASAQSCDSMLNDIDNWFITQPNGPGNYSIAFTMVTNRSDGKYASYSEGNSGSPAELFYHPASRVGLFWFPAYLQGTVRQYFSDRRWAPSGGLFAVNPFDPGRTDQTQVTISLGSSIFGSPEGEVTLTLLSWGNSQVSFPASCQDGLMYGFNGNTMFVMSLNKQYFPIIP